MIVFLISAASASAQPLCGPRAEVVASLAGERWREAPIAGGVSRDGELIEIWAAAEGRTWSLLVSRPDGLACLLAVGQDLRTAPPPERGRGL
jgi:hypothetical protein